MDYLSTDGVFSYQQMFQYPEMNIGKRIADRLEELSWQRKDLLEKLPELSAQALSNLIVRGSKRSEWDEAIAEALGVSVLWLVYGKNEGHLVSEPVPDYKIYSEPISEVIEIMEPLTNTEQLQVLGAVKLVANGITTTHQNSKTRTGS